MFFFVIASTMDALNSGVNAFYLSLHTILWNETYYDELSHVEKSRNLLKFYESMLQCRDEIIFFCLDNSIEKVV